MRRSSFLIAINQQKGLGRILCGAKPYLYTFSMLALSMELVSSSLDWSRGGRWMVISTSLSLAIAVSFSTSSIAQRKKNWRSAGEEKARTYTEQNGSSRESAHSSA